MKRCTHDCQSDTTMTLDLKVKGRQDCGVSMLLGTVDLRVPSLGLPYCAGYGMAKLLLPVCGISGQ